MKSFLQFVAEDLIAKHGTDLSRIAVVFPNKRAALFLNDYLAQLAGKPIWSPAYITISDLFRRHSTLKVADPIKLVSELYKCFVSQTGIDETLDHFYGWGQLLVADFDDLDKNMADASLVLANLRDLHELDDVSYLNQEQKAAIRRFFVNFSDDHQSELKKRFLQLWTHMADIYHDFNLRLREQGLAYEGALYRQVAESLMAHEADGAGGAASIMNGQYTTYVFVGFNMVQKAEQCLFDFLQKQGMARFYWDFDHYYMQKNEAGHYVGQYLSRFPNELSNDNADIYRQFSMPKHISFVSAPTENIQARYVSHWLRQHDRIRDGRRTAIVLCDERLLQTVIHCLPDEVDKVNITTGFPLVQSPAASFVAQAIALQTAGYAVQRNRFRLKQVNALLRHPFVAFLSAQAEELRHQLNEQRVYYPSAQQLALDEGLELLFTPVAHENARFVGWLCSLLQTVASRADSNDPLFVESVFRMYTLLNRLLGLIEDGDLVVDIITLERLIGQLVGSTTVPFHGEPAEGLQIMGVLETRNLDFDHVLLLSCNEGNMPKGVNDTSFIPYSLRKAYGLTTVDHKVSIYSYYFHRLLQRAKDVTILYNNATDDGQTGERSRFMLQFMVESPHHISFCTLQAGQKSQPFAPQPIMKSSEVMQKLLQRFAQPSPSGVERLAFSEAANGDSTLNAQRSSLDARPLPPTAINNYLRCQLLFYYKYVCGLRENEQNDDDTIDNRIFGNIFHEASRLVYTPLQERGRVVTKFDVEAILKSEDRVARAVDEALRQELFHFETRSPGQRHPVELNGLQLINREVIIHYVRQLLQVDRRKAPFTLLGLECDVLAPFSVSYPQYTLNLTIGGRIDRLDLVREDDGERIRVIDYKTGGSRLQPLPNLDAVFQQESLARHSDYYLQTLLYSRLVSQSGDYNSRQLPVSPALLFIQHAGSEQFDPVLFFGRDRIGDVAVYGQRFDELLSGVITDMFNPSLPFQPTADRQRCRNCAFRLLCSVKVAD